MYTAGQSSTSIRAALYERWDEGLHRKALLSEGIIGVAARDSPERRSSNKEPPPDLPRVVEKRTRLWAEPPERLRWESELVFDGRPGTVNRGVRDGDAWWRTTPAGQIESHTSEPHRRFVSAGFEHLLHPSHLIPSLELAPQDAVDWRGRNALVIFGTHRPQAPPDAFLHELGWPASGYEMIIDLQRGVLLRSIARFDGEIMKIHEVTEIAFDEDIPDETFEPLSA